MEKGLEFQPSTSSSPEKSASENSSDQSQGNLSDDSISRNIDFPRMPIVYPEFFPWLATPQHDQEQMNRGRGLYAVSVNPFMRAAGDYQTPTLVPFTYNLPTQPTSTGNSEPGGAQVRAGEEPREQQQAGPQRRVVIRRFQVAFQIDLFLILKLMAVIFLFNHDGSKQRLALLVFLAVIVYLYQTGALTPFLRWLSQGMQQRPAVPPRPPMAPGRAENIDAVGAQGNENAAGEGNQQNDGSRGNQPDGQPPQDETGNRWRALVKEIRLFVFGFISSLFPDFHHVD